MYEFLYSFDRMTAKTYAGQGCDSRILTTKGHNNVAELGHLQKISLDYHPRTIVLVHVLLDYFRFDAKRWFFLKVNTMRTAHAKSLRVIGQSLELAGITAFDIENDGESYVLRSEPLTQTEAWILRNSLGDSPILRRSGQQQPVRFPLRFSPADISRLDAQAQKKRGESGPLAHGSVKLSQLLRTLGDHLDRTEVNAFHISWLPDSISVDYQVGRTQKDSRTFTAEKLHQLGSHLRFRRANPRSW